MDGWKMDALADEQKEKKQSHSPLDRCPTAQRSSDVVFLLRMIRRENKAVANVSSSASTKL